MTRQEAYVAELSQLLFYMTPWDKAEALKNVNQMFEEAENEAELMEQLGTPMRLAVTLHREYEATPEPTEDTTQNVEEPAETETVEVEESVETETVEAEESAEVEEVKAEETAETEEVNAEESAEVEEVKAEESAEVEEVKAEETAETEEVNAEESAETEEVNAEESAETETVEAEESAETESAEAEVSAETEGAEETPVRTAWVIEEGPEKEKIFSEIFNAATEAQSAVVVEEPAQKETKRKPRYLFLIPYVVVAVAAAAIVVPVCLVANLAVTLVAVTSLVAMVYLVIFQFFTAPDLGSKLIVGGLAVVMLALTVIFVLFAVWFWNTATAGFPRFLLYVAKTRGYREVEVQ